MAAQQKASHANNRSMMESMPNPASFAPNIDTLMRANAEAGRIWMDNYNKMSREFMDFVSDRWNRDVEAMRRLSECRDPFQAFQVQADCMQTAMKQYMEEYAKLADMATDASVSAVKSLDEGVRTAADEARHAAEEARGALEETAAEATSKGDSDGQQKRKS